MQEDAKKKAFEIVNILSTVAGLVPSFFFSFHPTAARSSVRQYCPSDTYNFSEISDLFFLKLPEK